MNAVATENTFKAFVALLIETKGNVRYTYGDSQFSTSWTWGHRFGQKFYGFAQSSWKELKSEFEGAIDLGLMHTFSDSRL